MNPAPANQNPLSVWARFRARRSVVLPVLTWLVAAVCALCLAHREGRSVDALGYVELRQALVAPVDDGTLLALNVDIYDEVQPGQIVAMCDGAPVRAELAVAEAERERLRALLTAETERVRIERSADDRDHLTELRRFALDAEETRLDLLDRTAALESGRVELQRLETQVRLEEGMVDAGLLGTAVLDDTRLLRDRQRSLVEGMDAALADARERVGIARRRREERTAHFDPATLQWDAMVVPIRRAVDVQEARLDELHIRLERIALRAPIGGRVTRIDCQPGQTVLAGVPVMTIAAGESDRVIAYLDRRYSERRLLQAEVTLSTQERPHERLPATVLKVGGAFEPPPPELSSGLFMRPPGLPVLLSHAHADQFHPGQPVIVRFTIPPQTRP